MQRSTTPRKRVLALVAGTAMSFAVFAHGAVAHAAPGGPGGLSTTPTTQPPKCNPRLASCDITSNPRPKKPPVDCTRPTPECGNVDRPGDPGDPGDSVDVAVPGSPSYTG